jgi:ATP-dependent Lon protease
VYRGADGWLIKIELAGIRPEDVTSSFDGSRLYVSGILRNLFVEQNYNSYSMEISYSRFELTIDLSDEKKPARVSTEYHVIRAYIELVLELPWRKSTQDEIDIGRARQVLDEDHYDLKEVKERILEYLGVLKLNPQAKAPILCLVGPPGVGKTSLGQSITRAIGRKFERLSLGGLHDETELRGHRRTYIGAMPGRIIQAIRRVILPKGNEKDLSEIPDHIRAEMEFILAERIEKVLSAAIPQLAERLREALAAA